MADCDVSADESVLLHGADQRLYDIFCTARLAFKGDLSLVTAAADAPDAESLGKHTRQTVDTSVLDQVVKRGERKEDFGFLQKTLWRAPQYRQRKGPDGSGARSPLRRAEPPVRWIRSPE